MPSAAQQKISAATTFGPVLQWPRCSLLDRSWPQWAAQRLAGMVAMPAGGGRTVAIIFLTALGSAIVNPILQR